MMSVALKGLLQRRVRALLTGLAVVIGVATIAGAYILTDTISGAFGKIFDTAYSGADAVVTAKPIVGFDPDSAPTVPASVLRSISARPDVAAASGQVVAQSGARLTTKAGKPIDTGTSPSFAFGIDPGQGDLSQVDLGAGRLATNQTEVVIDAETAQANGYTVGDSIGIQTDTGTRRFTIVGLGTLGGSSLGSATIAVFDLATAQKLLNRGDAVDEVLVRAQTGTSAATLTAAIASELPATLRARTGAEEASAQTKDVNDDLKFINYFLLTFAAIALFVGSFVIVNTMSITLNQRTRELATLRTLGASRRQVMRSVIIESFGIGVVASVIGLLAGIGLARGLRTVFSALDLELPSGDTVIATRTIAIALVVGTVVTVLASILPARRASRVAPVAAVREGSIPPPSAVARRAPLIGAAMGTVGAAALAWSMLGDFATRPRLVLMGAGLVAAFIGIAAFLPRIVAPLARLVGGPIARLVGEPGRLGRENTTRAPGRTASTAAALMIGLALMTFVAVLGSGLRDSSREALSGQIAATHVVSKTDGFVNLTPGTDRAVAAAPGVTSSTGVRSGVARIGDDDITVSGVDPTIIGQLMTVQWTTGSADTFSRLTDAEAIVQESFATKRKLAVGSSFTLTSSAGTTRTATVAGIYRPARFDSLLSPVVLTQTAFGKMVPRASDAFVLARVSGAADAGTTALTTALTDYPDATVATETAFVESRSKSINQLLNLLYVLLALSVIVSLFGMINTLALAVLERTREVGMLRAVGMSRRQVRSMIRAEGITTALIGAAMGLPIGVGLAALVTKALEDYDVGFSLPVFSLVMFTAAAIVLGVLASSLPGRRAAKLDVLKALHYE